MKARHIVMIIVLVIFASIMFSLKDAKDTEKLVCSVNTDFQGLDSKITLNVKLKSNEIKDMNIIIDSVLPEEYKNQKQEIIDYMASSGKMDVTSTKEGIRFESGIGSEYFNSLGLNMKTNYNELKETLELQGYNCK